MMIKPILFTLILLQRIISFAQAPQDALNDAAIQKLIPKKFINNVELVLGSSLNFPNDHGFSDYVRTAPSTVPIIYKYNVKVGYSAGIGLIHSMKGRFDLVGRFLLERGGYYEEKTIDASGLLRRYTNNTNNDYMSFYFVPHYSLGKLRSFHLFAGGFYGLLLKSVSHEGSYLNGQYLGYSSQTNSPNIVRYTYGVSLGLGYSIYLSQQNQLVLQIQGSHALSDIININGLRITSQSLSFSIAFKHNRQLLISKFNKSN